MSTEPTLGELVKMQDEMGGVNRLRRRIEQSKNNDNNGDHNGNEGPNPPRRWKIDRGHRGQTSDEANEAPTEEPATLKKWKQKYGSRYKQAMERVTNHGKERPGSSYPTPKSRDPRFDQRCGEYIPEVFRSNYSFVKDMRQNEVEALKKENEKISRKLFQYRKGLLELSEEKLHELTSKQRLLKQLIKQKENRITDEQRRVEQYRMINDVKRKEALESAEQGRHPHFMNRGQLFLVFFLIINLN